MLPWLITTTAWPALTAQITRATVRVLVDPAVAAGSAAGALVFALTRVRRPRAADPGR